MHHRSCPRGVHTHPSHRTRLSRAGTRSLVGVVGVVGVLAAGIAIAPAATASGIATAVEACPPDAVTVVVDFTDLGGGIESGCADAGGSGTDALTAAGFTDARDTSGYICAIDGLPDPCPTEFTGSFWSYWYGADGQWQSYEVGSDGSAPEPGGVEGWRYGDGATPGVVPPAPAAEPEVTTQEEPADDDVVGGEPTPEASGDDAAAEDGATADEPSGGLSPAVVGGIGLVALLLVAAGVLARRRSGLSRGDGPGGQD